VSHVRVEVALDVERKSITGCCTTTLRSTAEPLRWVELDAVELRIHEVRVDGAPCRFDHDGRTLRVHFTAPRPPGDSIEVVVDYSATPRRGLYFIAPDDDHPTRPRQVWSQGQDEDNRCWIPLFDEPHQKATTELLCVAPAGWTVLSNGALVEPPVALELGTPSALEPAAATSTSGARRWHFRQEVPHSPYLITLVAGELSEERERYHTADGREVALTYLVPPGRQRDIPRTFGHTVAMMDFLARLTGIEYPYAKYAQAVVAEFLFGGMENTSATTLTELTLHDERAHLDYSSEPLIVHELAHQWFGNLLTCRDWSHGWLNEGFATYAECLWREHRDGRDEYDRAVRDCADGYFDEAGERYRRPIVTNVFHEPIDVFDAHLYEKGAVVLHLLRRELGDEPFFRALRHYAATHRQRAVITQDLANAVEEVTGRNIEPFLSQWVYRAGHPALEVSVQWEEAPGGLAIEVKQLGGDALPPYQLPLVVDYALALPHGGGVRSAGPGGRTDAAESWPALTRFEARIERATQGFFIPLPHRPALVILDPEQRWLAKATLQKAVPWWTAELRWAPRAASRGLAARALGRTGAPDAVDPLAGALELDPFWGVAADAATALGEHRGPAAQEALRAALTPGPRYVHHPKVRRAAVRALGAFFESPTAAATLRALVERGDPSYFVEAEAAHALGRIRAPGTYDWLMTHLARPSFQEVFRQHVYKGLSALRDERALPVLLAGARRGEHGLARRAATTALGAFTQQRELVREPLERLLEDSDFRVRMAAVESLDLLGDARSVGALGRVVERDLDGRVRRRGREVIRGLEQRQPREAALDGLREELARLQREHAALREQVAKLTATHVPAPPEVGPDPVAGATPGR
jgi:aminopeptidase N